ncbi:MAG: DUF1573 domain-containing protein [Bacteroidales bacterium]
MVRKLYLIRNRFLMCNCSFYLRMIAAMVVLFLMFSCDSNRSGNIPTDVVTNPNTANGESNMNDLPVIEFEKDFHDFGKVVQGEIVTYGFKFKNTGKSDLIISQVNTTCGCTVPEFPKTPIKPGEEKYVKVKFDSGGRKGVQNKSATVVTNCQPSSSVIRIRAQVIAL